MRFHNPAGRHETAGPSTLAATAMRVARTFRSLRAVALGAALSVGATAAGAQTISVQYDAACGPSVCGSVQFNVANTTGSLLELNSLTLFASGASYAFAPIGPTTVTAVDDFSPFPADATVGAGGTQIFIDFLNPGPFPFTLDVGNTGYLELQLAGTPELQGGAFTFSAVLSDQETVRGTVSVAGSSVVPEPSTYILMATGMGALGLIARRRRTS